ncbi:MAG: cysteine desulfurase NifS, partial [Clostridia bacterium]
LDARGICASTGSACSSGSPAPSHVLLSIGLTSRMSQGTLRITIGDENTIEDITYLVENLKEIIEKLRKENPEYIAFQEQQDRKENV